ncbi:multicopper oxidase domain-containing protein [Georgenia satyanarayanai]|uniref:multicopper oxidase domain-containing protein n=1 Tax=Georgenia satyanarayanai TaxID=860221 RepID=UPI00204173C1|nr:multicopper oxidase domain-containing protein [Georgenia satyanarayanai]MCM3661363.1 multicopper oxidase domain-containing protein [Georgenia satyanarayanai]
MTDTSTPRTDGALSRRSVLAGAAAAMFVPASVAALGSTAGAAPAVATGRGMTAAAAGSPATARATAGTVHKITMYVEDLGNGQTGYGLEPGKATIPGPLLEMYEGDTMEITLVNTTDRDVSIHPHGVLYDVNSDGSPFNRSYNGPGETRTYVWRTTGERSLGRWARPGTAGYWHYHDHAMGTPHGTGGVAAGLYGGLIVRRQGDILPDRQFTMVFNGMLINNKLAPNTPMFEANHGETVEFICIGHGDMFHTFHLHAHRWANTRTGYLEGPRDSSQIIDNRDLNGGDSFGFQVIAGEDVGPGAWMYHCHVQFHSDAGMSGIFLVRNADGSMPDGAQESIDWFHNHEGSGHH